MPAAARALFLALCALAAPAYLQASDPCSVANAVSTTKFNLAVDPPGYKESTNYTVTVNGTDNFTAVLLQALDTSTNASVGEWTMEPGTHVCSEKNLLYNITGNITGKSYTAHWKSPSTAAASVELRAFITEADALSFVAHNLISAPSGTTESPRVTATEKPAASNDSHATHTTHDTAKTSNGSALATTTIHTTPSGSDSVTYSSCILIAVVQSVYLLFIGGKQ